MTDPETVLTSREAMSFVRIGRTLLWALTKDGSIPAYRIGNGKTSSIRYLKSELLEWLRSRKIETARPLQPCASHEFYDSQCAECAMASK